MHELAIADALVRIASAHAGGRRIVRVEVRVGHLRQVVPDALRFAWALMVDGTDASGAELVLEEVPAVGRCRACGTERALPSFPLVCGRCASADVEVLQGEELTVEALELEDEMPVTSGRTGDGD